MVWPLQNDRTIARRGCSRESRFSEGRKSQRGRESEPFAQVQYSRHSSFTLFQERPTARSSNRGHKQERLVESNRRAGLRKFPRFLGAQLVVVRPLAVASEAVVRDIVARS